MVSKVYMCIADFHLTCHEACSYVFIVCQQFMLKKCNYGQQSFATLLTVRRVIHGATSTVHKGRNYIQT